MGENSNFSIYSIDVPTNQDVNITVTPVIGTVNYKYIIYKDNVIYKEANLQNKTNIYLSDTGTYKIVLNMYDSSNNMTEAVSGTYIIDKEAPVINAPDSLNIQKGENFNLNVVANDNIDNDLTDKIISNIDELDLNSPGHQNLTYTVSDTAGNKTVKTVDVNIINGNSTVFVIQIFLIVCLILAVLIALRFKKTLRLEKRLENYVLTPKNDKSLSLASIFLIQYKKLNKKVTSVLNKSVFLSKYAKKLDKYTAITDNHKSGMEIVTLKVLSSLLLLIVAFTADIIQVKFMPLYEFVIPLLVGFFVPDVLYFLKYKVYRKTIENDLLSAIIIMNNAFKAGRNITQAIEIVGNELEGTIAEEFKKMSLELSYGLEIDVIFKRFSQRVQLEEVSYLTASLTVLNKTGGNIVEVFSSIEKTMFNKKKLRLELNSLTGSSRIIVYVLLTIPFFFILLISVISPEYFLPFITTDLGLFLMGLMIIYYIIFVIVVRKIMKVVI